MAKYSIEHEINKNGNHVIKFKTHISLDNGYRNSYQGEFDSTMELFLHQENTNTRNGSGLIEWHVKESDMCEHIGVWWEHGKLVEYDGVFDFPSQAAFLMRKYGVKVPKDF